MNYKNRKNKQVIWGDYCIENADLLAKIGLESSILASEHSFREYATKGKIIGSNNTSISPSDLGDEKFWLLHEFITNFFDMDASLFEEFENSRVNRK